MAEIYKWCMGCFSHSLAWLENNGMHSGLIQYNTYFPIGSVESKCRPPYKSWRTQRNPLSGDIAPALQSLGVLLATLLIQVAYWRRNVSSSAHDYLVSSEELQCRNTSSPHIIYSGAWRHRAILQSCGFLVWIFPAFGSVQIWGLSAFLLQISL